MYLINDRQRLIIEDLIESIKPITAKYFATKYKVSIRTIRYDMDAIDLWLQENHIMLSKKPKIGYCLSISQKQKIMLLEKINVTDSSYKIFTKEERAKIIIKELLNSIEPVNGDYLSGKLGISNTTLLNDIKYLRDSLKKKDIFIEGKRGVGYKLVGDEMNIRKLIGNLLSNDLDNHQLLNLLDANRSTMNLIDSLKENIDFSSDIDIEKIKNAIKKSKMVYDFWIPDSSYISLILHIAIAIDRLKNNQEINISEDKIELLKTYKEYVLAKEISTELEDAFKVSIPQAEVSNITYHLISANLKLDYLQGENIYEVKSGLSIAIDEIMKYFKNNLTLPENSLEKLRMDLLSHLKLSIKKRELNIPNDNPLLGQIKENYGNYYKIAEGIVPIFDEHIGIVLDEDELSYITLYIAAQCELNVKDVVKNVLVVCTTGKGLAKVLSAKLERNFKELNIVDTISVFELEEASYNLEYIDFIISTLQIDNVNVPVLKVSLLLTDEEILWIKHNIYGNEKRLPEPIIQDSVLNASLASAEDIMIFAEIGQLLNQFKDQFEKDDVINNIWGFAIHIIMAIPRWRTKEGLEKNFKIELTQEEKGTYKMIDVFLEKLETKYGIEIPESERYSIAKYFYKEVKDDQ